MKLDIVEEGLLRTSETKTRVRVEYSHIVKGKMVVSEFEDERIGYYPNNLIAKTLLMESLQPTILRVKRYSYNDIRYYELKEIKHD